MRVSRTVSSAFLVYLKVVDRCLCGTFSLSPLRHSLQFGILPSTRPLPRGAVALASSWRPLCVPTVHLSRHTDIITYNGTRRAEALNVTSVLLHSVCMCLYSGFVC